jgi:hypothetical protein
MDLITYICSSIIQHTFLGNSQTIAIALLVEKFEAWTPLSSLSLALYAISLRCNLHAVL